MKKITIIRDKTMLWLVILSMALVAGSYISMMQNPAYARIMPMLIIIGLVIAVVYLVLISKLVLIVRFKPKSMTMGLLGMKTVPYDTIKKVSCENKIVLYFNHYGKEMVMPIMPLKEHEGEYRAILEELNARCDVTMNVDVAMRKLKNTDEKLYRGEEGKPPAIGGWLTLLMIQNFGLAIGSCGMVLIALMTVLSRIMGGVSSTEIQVFIRYGVIVPFVWAAVIMALRKSKKAIKWLGIMQWAIFVGATLGRIYGAIWMNAIEGVAGIVSFALGVVTSLVSALMVIRYLKVSRRVQRTFIRERSSKKVEPAA